ncbi:MAG: carbohydrate ABC transporter permease, partial [Spirochaetales bacterium]|nr:carbohydrate ABC transporter permease [Candidatus Physcosoma equi]
SLFSAAQMLLLIGSFKAQGRDTYNAARIDGAGDLTYINRVLVPLSGPAILTVLVQTLITTFNSYLWPLLVTNKPKTRTIQIGITMLGFAEAGETGAQMAAIAMVTLPFLLVLLVTKSRIENALIKK